ncbi:S-adenosyl-l-methionine hydroxide adenosyltransferase family protein [Candidatus Uabimicrobium sp. HlEnr_7]|uniref:SAM hydrolase/SAM-dependent halogenase family protein n=1 Tax=Candidatus Uabimicrobium helgolandensis TaxID=3095367 RepID=UPI003556820D
MIVTLTTDFGLRDSFVGAMKGVILSIAPDANLVDISHSIPPQDIRKADLTISSITPYYPKNTLHVVIVDPGVGSTRRILYVQANEQQFLAPDNGVLSSLDFDNIDVILEVSNEEYFLPEVSDTFHGRDIFAPVAGHLANGLDPYLLGREISYEEINQFSLPPVKLDTDLCRIYGRVIDIDHFGNITTNISEDIIDQLVVNRKKVQITLNNLSVNEIVTSYSNADYKKYLALINSNTLLEIAQNLGNAAKNLQVKIGAEIIVEYRK